MATIARVTRAKAPHSDALRLVSTPKLPHELSALDLAKALPEGSTRASSQQDWLQAVQDAPQFTHKRADSYRTLINISTILAHHVSWTTMAAMPTWARLVELSGTSRRTVARVLAELRKAGLLGIVVSGTTPQFAPMALADIEHNIASIYVLTKPLPLRLVADGDNSVNELGTPTRSLRSKELKVLTHAGAHTRGRTHVGARERDSLHESLRDQPFGGASRPDHDSFPWRTGPLWPSNVTPKRKDERLRAAWSVKQRLAGVKNASDQAIAFVLREFHMAGWTINDVMWALDHRRDGSPWPYSGMDGVTDTAHWMSFRLKDWRDQAGTVYQGRSAQQQLVACERRAEDVARREQQARERAVRATPEQVAAARARAAKLLAARTALAQVEEALGVVPAFTPAADVSSMLAVPGACEHGISRKLLPGGIVRCVVCRKVENGASEMVEPPASVTCVHGVEVGTPTRDGQSPCALCRSAHRGLRVVDVSAGRIESGECEHGFDAGNLSNGTPRCPMCRRSKGQS